MQANAHIETKVQDLTQQIPSLIFQAQSLAKQSQFGYHNRKINGRGETFWQYRQLMAGEAITKIDWRKSAHTEEYFTREQEQQAPATIWLCPDLSPNMDYKSQGEWTKREAALIICFLLAITFCTSGDKIGLPGLLKPTSSLKITTRLGRYFSTHKPDLFDYNFDPIKQKDSVFIVSDFFYEARYLQQVEEKIKNKNIVFIHILDNAELYFPFAGRTTFLNSDKKYNHTIEKAELNIDDYKKVLEQHKQSIRANFKTENIFEFITIENKFIDLLYWVEEIMKRHK